MHLVQGFYFIFWGLLVAVLTGVQLVTVSETQRLLQAFLGAGVIAALVGAWRLRQARFDVAGMSLVARRWNRRARETLVAAALMAYFSVFFLLWRCVPGSGFLLTNTFAFLGVGILFVIALNRAIAALAGVIENRDLGVEAKLFGAGNLVFSLLPFVTLMGYACVVALRNQVSALDVLQVLAIRANLVVILVMLLPFSLSLSLVWIAKDAALRRLISADAELVQAPSESDTD